MESAPPRRDHWSGIEAPEALERARRRLGALAADPSEIRSRRRFLDLLGPGPGDRVIEVGAGSGAVTFDLVRRVLPGGEVVALDDSRGLLAGVRRSAAELGFAGAVHTCHGDARTLPFSDRGFDHALCHWLLGHVEPQQRVVAEMARVVRPGGRIMCVEVDWETAVVSSGCRDLTRRIFHASCDRQVEGWAGRHLVAWLRAAGLQRVEVEALVDTSTGDEGSAWAEFVRERVEVAIERGVADREALERWWQELADAVASGSFFFSVTQFAVWGRVPR